jgi:hypothetical protein
LIVNYYQQQQAPQQGFFGQEEEEGQHQQLPALREDRPLGKGVPKPQAGEEGRGSLGAS